MDESFAIHYKSMVGEDTYFAIQIIQAVIVPYIRRVYQRYLHLPIISFMIPPRTLKVDKIQIYIKFETANNIFDLDIVKHEKRSEGKSHQKVL